MNLQSGAFGNPSELETLILFWSKMDKLHYPGAKDTKAWLEGRLKEAKIQAQLTANQVAPTQNMSLVHSSQSEGRET